jgi:hypothetical protein
MAMAKHLGVNENFDRGRTYPLFEDIISYPYPDPKKDITSYPYPGPKKGYGYTMWSR